MGKKVDYDVRSESNVYRSRPQTNQTNFRDSGNNSKMTVSRSMHKLDNLHDLSNIKQYKSKNQNPTKDRYGLIHIGPSMSRPPTQSYEYLKSGSPTLDNEKEKDSNNNTNNNSRTNTSPSRVKVLSSSTHPNLKLNLNNKILNLEPMNQTNEGSSDRQERIQGKASTERKSPKASSSERKDRVDVKPTFEVNTKYRMSRLLLRSKQEMRSKSSMVNIQHDNLGDKDGVEEKMANETNSEL